MNRKNIKKVATRQKPKYVTSEEQVEYQLSQGKQRNREVHNERAAKATTTMNRIGTIRIIHTYGQREHLVMSAGMTQYAFGVEDGDAGCPFDCGSHQGDVVRPAKEVQRNTFDYPGQRACD